MFRKTLLLMLGVAVFSGPALAQTGSTAPMAAPTAETGKGPGSAPPGPPLRRYRFSHVEDGVLRLDNESGQVLLCKPQAGAWTCKEVPERKAVLDNEIEQLKTRNEALQRQIETGRNAAADVQERMALGEKVAVLQTENNALKLRIDELKNQVTVLESLMGAQTERDAQKAEIAEQKSANATLKNQLATVEAQAEALQKQVAELTAPPPQPPEEVTPKSSDVKYQIREEMERARVVLEQAWRRMVEMIIGLHKDIMQKG